MSIVIPYRNFPIETLRPIAEAWQREAQGNAFGIGTNVDGHLADLARLANSPTTALLVLVKGAPVGYLGIEFWPNPMGTELLANEKYWYVIPEARGRDSIKLIRTAMQYAKAAGVFKMFFTASRLASEMHDKVCRLYEAMKMQPFETTYVASLDKGE